MALCHSIAIERSGLKWSQSQYDHMPNMNMNVKVGLRAKNNSLGLGRDANNNLHRPQTTLPQQQLSLELWLINSRRWSFTRLEEAYKMASNYEDGVIKILLAMDQAHIRIYCIGSIGT